MEELNTSKLQIITDNRANTEATAVNFLEAQFSPYDIATRAKTESWENDFKANFAENAASILSGGSGDEQAMIVWDFI